MRRLFPPSDLSTTLAHDVVSDEPGAADGDLELDDEALLHEYAYPEHRPWLRCNMVVSVDGVASVQGLSEGLSGAADKRVFMLLRALADVVLVGAGTARAEDYGGARAASRFAGLRSSLGQPPVPPIAVVSRSLGLDPQARVFHDTVVRPILLTCEAAPQDRRAALSEFAEIVVVGDAEVDPALARQALVERGLGRMLCEGGPMLLHQLVEADAIDELCVTTSPQLVGGGDRHFLYGNVFHNPRRLRLAALLEDEGDLFARYVVENR